MEKSGIAAKLSQVSSLEPGTHVTIEGRVHTIVNRGPNGVTEIVLRHDGHFVTAVLKRGATSGKEFVTAGSVTLESLLRTNGVILQVRRDSDQAPSSEVASLSGRLQVESLVVISAATESASFGIVSHDGPGDVPIPGEMRGAWFSRRLDDRVADLRVASTAAIFKLFSGVHQLTIEHLSSHNFHWVATPKLIDYQIPGDDDYFDVPYRNDKQVRLTQTSEVHLGLAIAADLERVYDIHTVFRREPIVSTRHLTEFTLVEVYSHLQRGWMELLEGAESLLIHLVSSLQERKNYQFLVAQASRLYPLAGAFKLGLDGQGKLLRITFEQAKTLLREMDMKTDNDVDFTRDEEATLGRYVASPESSLGPPSDVFAITHYPKIVRPFNFHPSAEDPEKTTNSFDILIRGQECCTSAQFRHSYEELRAAMLAREPPINPDSAEWRIVTAAYEAGMPPWGGYAVGLNRFVQGFLGLQDIHETVMFPRNESRLGPSQC